MSGESTDARAAEPPSGTRPRVVLLGTLDTVHNGGLTAGDPIAEPEDAAPVLARTDGVAGFFAAGSMERLPAESAMTATMQRVESIPTRQEQ